MVLDNADYGAHVRDPDLLVDWDNIQELVSLAIALMFINILLQRVYSLPDCAICLYPPVAAQMTRCGHVYCWPCVLHYMALSDKQWRKCPICFESIYTRQLRSVVSLEAKTTLETGQHIELQLMRRHRRSAIVLSADNYTYVHREDFLQTSTTLM